MKKTLLFLAVVLMGLSAMAQTDYTLVTSESELSAGDKLIFVGINFDDETAWAMSYQKTNNRHAIQIYDIEDEIVSLTVATSSSSQTEAYEITLGGQPGAWTFFDELNNGYLYAPGGGNYLKTQSTLDDKGKWTLSMEEEGFVPVSNGGAEQNIMRYNPNSSNNSPLFGCYKPSSNVTGLVYIFKAGGTSTVLPEPTNYPTNFTAAVSGVDVTLSWNDATGSQLPQKYLVLASTDNITVPTDGTPVANSNFAKNVNYGVQSVTFSGLSGGETYNFAIFPYTNSGANIDYKNDAGYPTANATLGDIYCLVNTNFANGFAPFTTYSIEGEQEWTTSSYDGVTFAKMSGYASGSAHENVDLLITPNLFARGSYETITISFKNAFNYAGPRLCVLISNDYDGVSDPNNFEWEEITDFFQWSTGSYTWQESGEFVMDDIEATRIYLAFAYYSTDEEASTWEITDVEIYGSGYNALDENENVSFNLYPNPANDVVRINAEADAVVEILDMAGRMLMSINVVEGENTINVAELKTGVYFVKMNSTVVKFVKR